MKPDSNNPQCKPEEIDKLIKLFHGNNWKTHNDGKISFIFHNFCQMYAHFNDDEKGLIYDLTKNYLLISEPAEYTQILLKLFKKIIQDGTANKAEKIFIVPVYEPDKPHEITDANSCVRLALSSIDNNIEVEIAEKLQIPQSTKEIIQMTNNFKNEPNALLVLYDDFIGSGNQAKKLLDKLIDMEKIDPNKIILLIFVIQEAGLELLQGSGITVRYLHLRRKGISDYYEEGAKRINLKIMENIEKTIGVVDKKFQFGFMQSEALVSMNKTPNNTFPIYWYKPAESKSLYKNAPFRRYKYEK
jgi:hypothetical protein